MRKWIWSKIQKCFQQEINILISSQKESHYREVKTQKDREATVINYPAGTKILLRSNEPDPLCVCVVIGHEDFGKPDGKILLIVKDVKTGAVLSSLNNSPACWSQEREEALNKLNWAEQWNVMSKYNSIDYDHQNRREQAYKEEKQGIFK